MNWSDRLLECGHETLRRLVFKAAVVTARKLAQHCISIPVLTELPALSCQVNEKRSEYW